MMICVHSWSEIFEHLHHYVTNFWSKRIISALKPTRHPVKILLQLCLEIHTCAYRDNVILSCSQNALAAHRCIATLPASGCHPSACFPKTQHKICLKASKFHHLSSLYLIPSPLFVSSALLSSCPLTFSLVWKIRSWKDMKQARVSKSWISYNNEKVLVRDDTNLILAVTSITCNFYTREIRQDWDSCNGRIQAWALNHCNCWTPMLIPANRKPCCHELQNMETPQWSIQ